MHQALFLTGHNYAVLKWIWRRMDDDSLVAFDLCNWLRIFQFFRANQQQKLNSEESPLEILKKRYAGEKSVKPNSNRKKQNSKIKDNHGLLYI